MLRADCILTSTASARSVMLEFCSESVRTIGRSRVIGSIPSSVRTAFSRLKVSVNASVLLKRFSRPAAVTFVWLMLQVIEVAKTLRRCPCPRRLRQRRKRAVLSASTGRESSRRKSSEAGWSSSVSAPSRFSRRAIPSQPLRRQSRRFPDPQRFEASAPANLLQPGVAELRTCDLNVPQFRKVRNEPPSPFQ